MTHEPLLSVSLVHAYYGAHNVEIDLSPNDLDAWARHGLLSRRDGNVTTIFGKSDARPAAVSLDLLTVATRLRMITVWLDQESTWEETFPLKQDLWLFGDGGFKKPVDLTRPDLLGALHVALPPTGARSMTLRFETVASHWVYHVIGAEDADLAVRDRSGTITFLEIPAKRLPDGRLARLFLSDRRISARLKPDAHVSLVSFGAEGMKVLIDRLPAATGMTRKTEGGGLRPTEFTEDIFVTL